MLISNTLGNLKYCNTEVYSVPEIKRYFTNNYALPGKVQIYIFELLYKQYYVVSEENNFLISLILSAKQNMLHT